MLTPEYLLKATLGMGVLYAIFHWWLAQGTHHRFNRVYLLAALLLPPVLALPSVGSRAGLELLPPATVWLPELLVPAADAAPESAAVSLNEMPAEIGYALSMLIWSVSAILLVRLLVRYWLLWNRLRQLPRQCRQGFSVLHAPEELPTFAFFNWLVWHSPAHLSEQEAGQVWAHELAHIRQGHAYDLLLAEVMKALFWFQPFVYGLARHLSAQHEFLADRAVLQRFGQPEAYARLIVRCLFPEIPVPVHQFSQSLTVKRLQMMKKSNSPLWAPLRAALLAPAALLTVMAVSCESSLSPSGAKDKEMPPFTVQSYSSSPAAAPKGAESQIFEIVEHSAEPVEGFEALYRFIGTNIRYPEQAKDAGIEGKVYVQFVVETDGRVSEVKSLKGPGYGLDEEAVRVVSMAPAFKPGRQSGQAVRQRLVLPVMFALK